ncbi:TIGR01458 family HAD-type hydrolase [Leptospira sp. 96542]|nr:TIGR01458 family HAD-type hydrolase [Leptospira sp. 96542]
MPSGQKIGFLLDLEGVFHQGAELLPGAKDVVTHLRQKQIPFIFLTNTTTKSELGIRNSLNQLGLDVREREILTTAVMATTYLQKSGNPRTRLVVAEEIESDFSSLTIVNSNPEAVLIGDIGSRWNYDLLNSIFRDLYQGARLIALHKSKYWQTDAGLSFDIGGFITGLEYASGVEAEVIGKPSKTFFLEGLNFLDISSNVCYMVGDDLESDIGGAQKLGIQGVLVKTGKFREGQLDISKTKPDLIWEGIGNLLDFV